MKAFFKHSKWLIVLAVMVIFSQSSATAKTVISGCESRVNIAGEIWGLTEAVDLGGGAWACYYMHCTKDTPCPAAPIDN